MTSSTFRPQCETFVLHPEFEFEFPKNLNQRRTYLIGAGGLVGPVVVAKVLVRLRRLRFCVSRRLVDGRDIVAQGDGFHGLVDATADALANLGCGRQRLLRCRWSAGVTAGGLGCGL